MKSSLIKHLVLVFTVSFFLASASASAAEEWKGKGYDQQFQVSALTGMTLMGNTAGFGIMALLAKQILNKGFFPDMANQAYIEASFGPAFMTGGTGFQIGAHLRWDFHKNELWSLYALGGLGWDIIPAGFTKAHAIHPRFGLGAFWHLFPQVSFRGEISHEFTGVGAAFMF
jgi:hypothetical protein